MKKIIAYFTILIAFYNISISVVNAEEIVNKEDVQINQTYSNEKLIEKYLNSIEKDQIDKKEIYEVLIQTKNDKITLLQGNVSAILTWGGIVLTIFGIVFTFFAFWLNRVFSTKVDEVNKKMDDLTQKYSTIQNTYMEIKTIERSICNDKNKISNFSNELSDFRANTNAGLFELNMLKIRTNYEIIMLKYKNVLEEIQRYIDEIDALDLSDNKEAQTFIEDSEYNTYIKKIINESYENYKNWTNEKLTENDILKLDDDESTPDEELESDYEDAIYRLNMVIALYNKIHSL